MKVTDIEALISSKNQEALSDALSNDPSLAKAQTSMGVSLITFACYYRNTDAVAIIRPYLSNVTLYEACCTGELAQVKDDIERKPARLNSWSPDGFTPLGLACFFGHEDLVNYLLGLGADVNIASNNALKVAPIHSACAISNFSITRKLVEAGANVNARQQRDFVPLHSACQQGNLEIVELLVDNGARTDAKSADGKLPADLASENGFKAVADYLKAQAV